MFFTCVCNISSCLQQCKNYKNRGYFSRVIITNVLPPFFRFTVYMQKMRVKAHISSVCWPGYFRLRQLRTIRWSLMSDATRALFSWGVRHLPPGLLQLTSCRHRRRSSPVCMCRLRQLVWSPALVVTTTSRRSSEHIIGFQFVREWSSRRLCWCQLKCIHTTWRRVSLGRIYVLAASTVYGWSSSVTAWNV